ncbi:hypothetical protein L195_g043641 [Trifolium pratense]|uniref:Transmembrane protein n=1 Tax=Trifolium pratense TaxID=57577 RepID=A0A2K3M9T8_TRIPR|nr:uncharacterized protein LOC123921883 [Trifolium pratense]PNX87550.1 hypothetical protein L195_g043641 [Trifolium pratense]
MNLLLDSNVEALAFNYLNFGLITILNNLWTWLALLTAALSFWKIRSSGCPKEPISIKADTCVSISTISVNDEMTEIETPIKKTSTEIFDGVDGVMKGKFTVYFKDDMQCGLIDSTSCYDRLLPVAEGWEQEGELEWCKCWEKVLRLRNGVTENGWYTCQDLTELNGNVVKIWDGGLRFVGS